MIRILTAFAIVMLLAAPLSMLHAERRSYEVNRPLGEVIQELIDAMGASGMQFEVQQVYNAKTDGRQGMRLLLAPQNKVCELIFLEDAERKRSVIRVFTQDQVAGQRFHRLLTEELGMRESGVHKIPENRRPWPVQPDLNR